MRTLTTVLLDEDEARIVASALSGLSSGAFSDIVSRPMSEEALRGCLDRVRHGRENGRNMLTPKTQRALDEAERVLGRALNLLASKPASSTKRGFLAGLFGD